VRRHFYLGGILVALALLAAAPSTGADRHVSLLATGDSMMDLLDAELTARFSSDAVTVAEDARPSTGLTKPYVLDWPRHAAEQVAEFQPTFVVVNLGANDGYPLGLVRCCSATWVRRYARRVDQLVDTYAEGGTDSVYWCLLPAPAPDKPMFRRYFMAVNKGIRRGVRMNPDVAHVVDLPEVLSPGYRFRQYIGDSNVRADDGVHLTPEGAAIAADVIQQQLEDDGLALSSQ
jgi:hypothetical protein